MDAAIALAEAIAGQGIERRNPVQSRVNLIADRKGLLRVDRDAVIALNRLTGISVFTLLDGLAVVPGKNIAGAKISPVAVQHAVLDEALAIAARAPVVEVKPFTPKRARSSPPRDSAKRSGIASGPRSSRRSAGTAAA